ncbi:DUF494 family protein [bacterium]|nr:MAG: DUF494 family protein [bacterium]
MQENVIDIIVSIFRRIQAGEGLKEIQSEDFSNYQKSEFIAAYSYVLEHQENTKKEKLQTIVPRILHLAERLVLTPQAYGYLLELNKLGMLSYSDMEFIIEKTMLNSTMRIELDQMKTLVARYLYQHKNEFGGNFNFSGNESIN